MRARLIALAAAAALLIPAQLANADEVKVPDLTAVKGLTPEQSAAVKSFISGGTVSAPSVSAGSRGGTMAARYSASRRASFYRGSALMWTRDNVDFGYDWSSVTWTSAFQQAGWIWPNIARNRGISKYYNTRRNDRFRAKNTIGAGVPTPWGDVKVYSSDFVHRLSVYYNGAWSAWSD